MLEIYAVLWLHRQLRSPDVGPSTSAILGEEPFQIYGYDHIKHAFEVGIGMIPDVEPLLSTAVSVEVTLITDSDAFNAFYAANLVIDVLPGLYESATRTSSRKILPKEWGVAQQRTIKADNASPFPMGAIGDSPGRA